MLESKTIKTVFYTTSNSQNSNISFYFSLSNNTIGGFPKTLALPSLAFNLSNYTFSPFIPLFPRAFSESDTSSGGVVKDTRLGKILAPRLIHLSLLSRLCHTDARWERRRTKTGQRHIVSFSMFVCV